MENERAGDLSDGQRPGESRDREEGAGNRGEGGNYLVRTEKEMEVACRAESEELKRGG